MPRRRFTHGGPAAIPYIETRDSSTSFWAAGVTSLGFTKGIASSFTFDASMTVINSDKRFLAMTTTQGTFTVGVPLYVHYSNGQTDLMAQKMTFDKHSKTIHTRSYFIGTTHYIGNFKQDVPIVISWTRPVKGDKAPLTLTIDGKANTIVNPMTDLKLSGGYMSVGGRALGGELDTVKSTTMCSHVRLYSLKATQDGRPVCVLRPMRKTVDGVEQVGLYNEVTGVFHEAKNMDYGVELAEGSLSAQDIVDAVGT